MTSVAAAVSVSVNDVLTALGADVLGVLGRSDRRVTHAAPLGEADACSLSFCSQRVSEPLARIRASRAGIVICQSSLPVTEEDHRDRTLILVENPRLAFMRALRRLFHVAGPEGIHPTAVLSDAGSIALPTTIGPYCYVAPEVRIGPDARLAAHVTVHSRTTIGARARIHTGAVIGTDGFGYERNPSGQLERFEQIGGVVIDDDVDIGSQAVVNRGTLGNTVIGRGTKIANLVNVGHNVSIGRDVFVSSGCVIAGGVSIGDGAWIATGVKILENVVVGRRAMVAMGSVVVRDVPDDARIAGVPGRIVPAPASPQ
jgi:UDP-3-O-[3-hydroxymyristoyl] glucosamine N-acyltransferase